MPGVTASRRWTWGLRWARPEAQMAEYLLDDLWLVDHSNDPHRALADWAAERVGVPSLQNQVAPLL